MRLEGIIGCFVSFVPFLFHFFGTPPQGSPGGVIVLLNKMGCEVWSTTFYMGKFNGPTAKRHRLWSNDPGLLEEIHARGGYLSKQERTALKGEPLTKIYTDSKGIKRFAGIPDKLKASQRLGCFMRNVDPSKVRCEFQIDSKS